MKDLIKEEVAALLNKRKLAQKSTKHIKCKKHQRNGEKLPINCDKCNYTGITPWNLRMHYLSIHSTKDERAKCDYYCTSCDKVYFCSSYFNSHNYSTKHKNMVFIKNNPVIN